MKTIVALYDNVRNAQRAVSALRARDAFRPGDVSILMNDSTEAAAECYTEADSIDGVETRADDSGAAEGAATGAGIGATIGAIGGLLVGLGVVALPGGSVIVAGPLASALIGAVGGAAAGGLIGALVGLGISEDDANVYAEAVRRGGKLVLVRCNDDNVTRAAQILNQFDPVDIREREKAWRAEGWDGQYDNKSTLPTDETSYVRVYRSSDNVKPVHAEFHAHR